jgi:transcriptional regulator with XRE-family HTH domain
MVQRDAAALARRLRLLRRDRWPDRRLTQQAVADALGVALSSVSSWENTKSVKAPPAFRIADYATFFATPRSIDGDRPRLLAEDELTDAERAERDRLVTELEQLRAAAVGDSAEPTEGFPRSLWHFPDGGPVRIICGPVEDQPPYASIRNHNYMQLTAYRDLDALVELFGHVRVANPDSIVRFDLATRLESDDLRSHLVLLGSPVSNEAVDRVIRLTDLPVRQVTEPEIDGEVFELVSSPSTRLRPEFLGDDPKSELIEDVGMFYRAPNPYNMSRTLTLCSGVFTRGVYGAVRILTDRELCEENEAALASLFGDASTFGLLMRVPIFDQATGTPDLQLPRTILSHWSETGG